MSDPSVPVQEGKAQEAAAPNKAPSPGSVIYLRRYTEPREGAFTVSIPQGWVAEGGVVRLDPNTGPTNSVGAKIDFAVKKDPAGTVMIHWFPNFTYKDPRYLMGGFPIGSNYMGCPVFPMPDPFGFLADFAFRRTRPQAAGAQVIQREPLPAAAQQYQQRATPGITYQAGSMTVAYEEGGVRYKEKLVAIIENTGQMGLGMWTNRATTAIRAPEAEFDKAARLLAVIEASLRGNPQWVAMENRGAAVRSGNALRTQRYLQDQMNQIVEHRRETYAEMRHSSWLFLTGQEDYVNPHTGEVEVGSNEYKQRWINGSGDVIYTDDPAYDPRWDPNLKGRTDYELSRVRPR